jgi:hypothetical protein
VYGSDQFPKTLPYSFLVESKPGAKNPPLLGQICYGYDLSSIPLDSLRKQKFTLKYLLNAYQLTPDKNNFMNDFFIKLAGTGSLENQLLQSKDEETIRQTWQNSLDSFKAIRKKYLLYKDFE